MNAHILLVYGGAEPKSRDRELAARLRSVDASPEVVVVAAQEAVRIVKSETTGDAPCIVVTLSSVEEPLHVARSIAAERPYTFFVFVVSPEKDAKLRQATLYGAPPGGRWSIVADKNDELPAQIDASLRAASQQRRFRATVDRIALQLAKTTQVEEPEYRRLIASDQYLANVLQHAHDAIVSLTPEGEVVSWNRATETVLGVKAGNAIGMPFSQFFDDSAVVDEAISLVIHGQSAREDLLIGFDESARVVDAIFAKLGRDSGEVDGITVIMRDVTNQRRLEAEAKLVDRRKDEFLAMLAHELRNPLAAIRNAGEMLRLIESDDRRVHLAGAVVSRQSEHMSSLLADLLDVSRVTRGLIKLDKAVLSPHAFVSRAVEQVRGLIDSKRHHLTVTTALSVGKIYGDKDRLTQIVANILHNAAKYTPQGGQIELVVDGNENEVAIKVIDNGIGIDSMLLPHVFDLFTQAARSLDRKHGGLGIGLALVRSLVRLHGGDVFAESAGEGLGSGFTVTFPVYRLNENDRPNEVIQTASDSALRQTILVVDDNEDAAVSLKMIIELGGHEVSVAHSGVEALELVEHHRFNVFVLDIGMPEMDGLKLAARLRALPQSQHSLLIAHTGYGQPEDRARTRDAGFDHHLTKPADPLSLLQLIANS